MNTSFGNAARLIGAGLRALLVLTLVTGVIYPLVVTGIAQGLFNDKANGSEIKSDGKVVGSSLIGQTYNLPKKAASDSTTADDAEEAAVPDLKWFQPRPSNGLGSNSVNTQYSIILSGATNRSGDNEDLIQWVKDAKAAVVKDNSTADYKVTPSDVPADAVTSSGSGLDPHISPEYAELQAHRVAEKNGLPVAEVEKLVADHTQGRILGFMGEPRVNVLELNIALKDLASKS
ncbi:potassium-transporting ATPase subunit C [Streptomyces sp. NPDC007861]|uniref:potassium-transporting ATPase subunit C n=1 Tax=Streptomyces sp. NPDC007861 TaxID=3154893 RepID=UPI0033C54675